MYLTMEQLLLSMPASMVAQLTDDVAGRDVNPAVINETITQTCGLMDGYLGKRYVLPLQGTCTQLTEWAVCLVRYALYMRRPDGRDLPEAVVRAYKDALKFLADVRDGKLDLPVTDSSGNVSDPPTGSSARKTRLRRSRPLISGDVWDRYGRR